MPRTLTEQDKENGDLMPLQEFLANCECGGFIDYDGFGHPIAGEMLDEDFQVTPSERKLIPAGTTHVLWFNR